MTEIFEGMKAILQVLELSYLANPSKAWRKNIGSTLVFSDELEDLKDVKYLDELVHSPEFLRSPYAREYHSFQLKIMRFLRKEPELFKELFPDIDQTQYWETTNRLDLFTTGSDLYRLQNCLEIIAYRPSRASELVNWPHKQATNEELKHWLIVNFVRLFLKSKKFQEKDVVSIMKCLTNFDELVDITKRVEKLMEQIELVRSNAPDSAIIRNELKDIFVSIEKIMEYAKLKNRDSPVLGFWMSITEFPGRRYLNSLVSEVGLQIDSLSEQDFGDWLCVIGFSRDDASRVSEHFAKHEQYKYFKSMKEPDVGSHLNLLGDVFLRPAEPIFSANDPNVRAFKVPYIEQPAFNGNRLKAFLDDISEQVSNPRHNSDSPMGKPPPKTVPIAGLNQSSGFGKSKLFHHPVPGVIFVYMCFRVAEEIKTQFGYPTKSQCAENFKFDVLTSIATTYGKQEAPFFVSYAIDALTAFVLRLTSSILKSEKFDAAVAHKAGLCFSSDEFELYKEELDLEKARSMLEMYGDKFKIVLVYDELASLSFATPNDDSMSGYRILRHILAHSSQREEGKVNGLPLLMNFIHICIDTNTTAAETHPAQVLYTSHRLFTDLNVQFPEPFVLKSTQDVFLRRIFSAASVTSWNLYVFSNLSFVTALAFGRPLWYSYLAGVDNTASLVEAFKHVLTLAESKFVGQKHGSSGMDSYSMFQNLMITTGIVSPTDSHTSSELVKSRLAHLHQITRNGSVSISYISEPILSAYALNSLGNSFQKTLQEFSYSIKNSLMNVGSLGEFVSVILLLYAFHKTGNKGGSVRRIDSIPEKKGSNSGMKAPDNLEGEHSLNNGYDIASSEDFFAKCANIYPKPVSAFLSVLMGAHVYNEWRSRVSSCSDMAERARLVDVIDGTVQMNHSVYYPNDERDYNLILREAIARRAMVKCFGLFPTIDIIIPVVSSSGLVTGIGISVKRNSQYKMKGGSSSEPYKVVLDHMGKFSTACLPCANPLVHCDNLHGGDVHKNKWIFMLMSLCSDSSLDRIAEVPLKRTISEAEPEHEAEPSITVGSDSPAGNNVDLGPKNYYIDDRMNIALFGVEMFCPDVLKAEYGDKIESIYGNIDELLCMRPGLSYGKALERKASYPIAVGSVTEYWERLGDELRAYSHSAAAFQDETRRKTFWKAVLAVILSIRCGKDNFSSLYQHNVFSNIYSFDRLPKWKLDSEGLGSFKSHFHSSCQIIKESTSCDPTGPVMHFVHQLCSKIDALSEKRSTDFKIQLTKDWCGLAKNQ